MIIKVFYSIVSLIFLIALNPSFAQVNEIYSHTDSIILNGTSEYNIGSTNKGEYFSTSSDFNDYLQKNVLIEQTGNLKVVKFYDLNGKMLNDGLDSNSCFFSNCKDFKPYIIKYSDRYFSGKIWRGYYGSYLAEVLGDSVQLLTRLTKMGDSTRNEFELVDHIYDNKLILLNYIKHYNSSLGYEIVLLKNILTTDLNLNFDTLMRFSLNDSIWPSFMFSDGNKMILYDKYNLNIRSVDLDSKTSAVIFDVKSYLYQNFPNDINTTSGAMPNFKLIDRVKLEGYGYRDRNSFGVKTNNGVFFGISFQSNKKIYNSYQLELIAQNCLISKYNQNNVSVYSNSLFTFEFNYLGGYNSNFLNSSIFEIKSNYENSNSLWYRFIDLHNNNYGINSFNLQSGNVENIIKFKLTDYISRDELYFLYNVKLVNLVGTILTENEHKYFLVKSKKHIQRLYDFDVMDSKLNLLNEDFTSNSFVAQKMSNTNRNINCPLIFKKDSVLFYLSKSPLISNNRNNFYNILNAYNLNNGKTYRLTRNLKFSNHEDFYTVSYKDFIFEMNDKIYVKESYIFNLEEQERKWINTFSEFNTSSFSNNLQNFSNVSISGNTLFLNAPRSINKPYEVVLYFYDSLNLLHTAASFDSLRCFGVNCYVDLSKDSLIEKSPDNLYKVALTSENETFFSDNVYIDPSLIGIKEINEQKLSVLPNPADNFILISTSESIINGELKIISLTGQEIKSELFNGISKEINVNDLSNGSYLLILKDDSKTQFGKFIKN